jgi:hypothetical protein
MGVRVVEGEPERQFGNPTYGPPQKIRHLSSRYFVFAIFALGLFAFSLFM